jgi:hypothetical protein
MGKYIVGYDDPFTKALFDLGIVKERPDEVRRIVIDLEAGCIGRIYVEKFADGKQMALALGAGIDWKTVEP